MTHFKDMRVTKVQPLLKIVSDKSINLNTEGRNPDSAIKTTSINECGPDDDIGYIDEEQFLLVIIDPNEMP